MNGKPPPAERAAPETTRTGCFGVAVGINLAMLSVALTAIARLLAGPWVPAQAVAALLGIGTALLCHGASKGREARLWQRVFILLHAACLVVGLPAQVAWWSGG